MSVVAENTNLVSPVDGEPLTDINYDTQQSFNSKVERAKVAYKLWCKQTSRDRAQIFYRYRELLIAERDILTELVHRENGKTLAEAAAEVDKSIEVTEFACSIPQFTLGENSVVSQGINCQMTHEPLGVVANITPSNFPLMVPHWTLAICLALGNTLILKPSEKVPLSVMHCADLLRSAGLPDGCLEIVNGGQETVEWICDHPDIKAISFVGSTRVAKAVYRRATHHLKRALCLGGAKNHILVLPDANKDMTANNIAVSMAGCAGQRCMAASAMVGVGNIDPIVDAIKTESQNIVPGENLGAVISKEAKERIEHYIQEAIDEGATLVLDGRNPVVPGKEKGYYIGPTILDHVTPTMNIANEEVFGPVLAIIRTDTMDEAIQIQNKSNYGNGAAVFTQSGRSSQYIARQLKAGMVGVNIGIPVPREPFSFGGWDDSKFGTGDITGKSAIHFWTQLKKTTTKWNPDDKKDWMS